eukprot:tig00020553_g10601.t1
MSAQPSGNMAPAAAAQPAAPSKYKYTGSHPIAATFHVLFKASALFMYMFSSLFTDSFVTNFVIITLLLAFDFWTVKNVTGRLLVGLRWWNEVKEDGSNEWIFESAGETKTISSSDKTIFWGALLIAPGLWGLFAFTCLFTFKFQWLTVVILALVLNCANVVGYVKCNKDAKKKVQQGLATASLTALTGWFSRS